MTPCPINAAVDCQGPPEGKLCWVCPVHGARLTAHWTVLCRTRRDYRRAWSEGRGPGQSAARRLPRPRPAETYDGRIEREIAVLAAALRRQILTRRNRWENPDLGFDQCCRLAGCRSWPEILASIGFCVRRCVELEAGGCSRYQDTCAGRTRWRERIIRRRCPVEEEFFEMACRQPTRFITLDDLRADTLALAGRLPPTLTRIVAVARSGIIPGSMLATLLHLPLWSTSPAGLVDLGTTYRLRPREADREHVLLVDDTAHSGKAMQRYGPVLQQRWPEASLTKAVIYTTPPARRSVDLAQVTVPAPHYLEWHLFNSPYANAAMDFDGILCEEIAADDDDDGPRYREALRMARPKYLVRYCTIPLVVTARLDRPEYRQLTLEWLARHRIRVDRLVMGPWKSLQERDRPREVARFKVRVYRESPLKLFVESCPDQARQIARETRKPVLCPAAKLVFRS